MTRADLTVIVPVFNEEALLAKTLDSIERNLGVVSAEVIVACNGCIDHSVLIAENHPIKCVVLDLQNPSKTGAINAAEKTTTGFPRVYLDGDVELSDNALQLVRDRFRGDNVNFVALGNQTTYANSSGLVRRYYRVWQSLPYVKSEGVGSGFFAMSEAGRARFGEFPDIVADDEYVRRFFDIEEVSVIEDAYTKVRAPLTLVSFIRTKVRGRIGAYQLAQKFPGLSRAKKRGRFFPILTNLCKSANGCADAIVYIGLTSVIRLLALVRYSVTKNQAWYQDKSGRSS